jgi:MOSC domain-containing protein YiiM
VQLMSVNVGRPREIDWHGRLIRTSIWKAPVEGPVRVSSLNLEGDEQSELPAAEFPWGAFGENFTTAGLLEPDISIGDRLRVGSAEFLVTQPRMPCFKLGLRFGREDMVKRFLHSGRSGFYLAVVREGAVASGDALEFVKRDEHTVAVADITALYTSDKANESLRRRALEVAALPDSWKEALKKRQPQ